MNDDVKKISIVLVFMFAPHTIKVHGYSGGAGLTACENSGLRPNHYGTQPQTSNSPYEIVLSALSYDAGRSLTVTLRGNTAFKGFLVLALPENDPTGSAVGVFAEKLDGKGAALSQAHCTGGATHTTTFSGSSPNADLIELTWTAPSTTPVNLIFYATFVKTQAEYWVKLPSLTTYPVGAQPLSSTISSGSSVSSTSGSSSTATSTAASSVFTSLAGSSTGAAHTSSSTSTRSDSLSSNTSTPTAQLVQQTERTTSAGSATKCTPPAVLYGVMLLLLAGDS